MKGGEDMITKVLRGIFTFLGVITGISIVSLVQFDRIITGLFNTEPSIQITIAVYCITGLLAGLIFFIIFPLIKKGIIRLSGAIEKMISEVKFIDVVFGTIGLITGLFVALLISFAFSNIPIPWLGESLTIIVYLLCVYVGILLPVKKQDEIQAIFHSARPKDKDSVVSSIKGLKKKTHNIPKILDTSVIIDGRIFDICETDFMEGPIIIPEFVLNEVQYVADSSDALKRTRGRRGLDILNKIQNELNIQVIISDKDYPDISEVDGKLVKLAKDTKGKIVTNDYNLNKVAGVQGVDVLNINDLANAIKPVVIPGEDMIVNIVKDGKEHNQGLAYLEDGTMIVVEGGKRHVGNEIKVEVTRVLQTSAGRMIFAKPQR
jgi:uncharacterized protein YacL